MSGQSEPHPITIIDTKYIQKHDLVIWTVRFEDKMTDNVVRLAWLSKDLGDILGINKPIPPAEMTEFCQSMRGKKIKLVITPETMQIPDLKKIGNEELREHVSDVMSRFPFYEVLQAEGEL